MMNIAYLIPIYPMPSQTFIRREIIALEAQGIIVHRFAMRRFAGTLIDEADQAEQRRACFLLDTKAWGLTTAFLMTALRRPRRWATALATAIRMGLRSERGLIRHLIYLAEACTLQQQLVMRGAQHLHAHFGSNSADVALLCRLLGGPSYSITIHGPDDFDAPRPLGLREKVHHATFVAAISEYSRSQLYRWCALEDWPKIHVIRCGLDADFLPPVTMAVPAQPRLVNVGRLCEQKGQLLLIEAAARLRDQGLEFELVIVGDGPMRDEIEQLIERCCLQKQVRITGFLSNEDVRQELQQARALVLPSFAEGLPVVVMEALALSRPVISTYIAGIPELVEPGVNGWLIPAGALEPLVDAMAEALTAVPSKLERMGRAGAAQVADRHSIAIEARKLAGLFSNFELPSPRPNQDQPLRWSSENNVPVAGASGV
jgi:colanic acid/amylovoran biosynthesis glycosyltransferase